METKIGIGIPNTGTMKVQTVLSLINLLSLTPYQTQIFMQTGCYIHVNREDLVRRAIKENCTHILFIDTDLEFPADGLIKLISMNKDIVGARYNLKKLPLTTTLKFKDAEGNYIAIPGEQIPTVHFQCAAVPTGFMLINLNVFKVLKEPWFWYEYHKKQNNMTGEDVLFCEKALKAGFQVWCDPTIEVKHIGDYAY